MAHQWIFSSVWLERYLDTIEVVGSNPIRSTMKIKNPCKVSVEEMSMTYLIDNKVPLCEDCPQRTIARILCGPWPIADEHCPSVVEG